VPSIPLGGDEKQGCEQYLLAIMPNASPAAGRGNPMVQGDCFVVPWRDDEAMTAMSSGGLGVSGRSMGAHES